LFQTNWKTGAPAPTPLKLKEPKIENQRRRNEVKFQSQGIGRIWKFYLEE
jgi:hypothetical protein